VKTPRRGARRIAVRVSADVWREEVERFGARSQARRVADRERRQLEREGVRLADAQPCAQEGPGGTHLDRLLKVYAPITQVPPSQRPFAFVFAPGRDEHGAYLALFAFGERHPRPGVRSVYERAHKRRHGRYPPRRSRTRDCATAPGRRRAEPRRLARA
jgi:hypothetical protein